MQINEVMENKILILDIETTSTSKKQGHIVEVGIVELDLTTGNKKIIFNKVTHEKGITKEEVEKSWIVSNSDLTTEDIRNSTRLDVLQPEIQAIIDKYPLGATAYNNAFDFGWMEDRGFTFPKKLPCPMKLSTDICKIPKKGRGYGYKWPSCEEAYNFFFPDSNFIEKHRGADDALHEADIVCKLYQMGVFKIVGYGTEKKDHF